MILAEEPFRREQRYARSAKQILVNQLITLASDPVNPLLISLHAQQSRLNNEQAKRLSRANSGVDPVIPDTASH